MVSAVQSEPLGSLATHAKIQGLAVFGTTAAGAVVSKPAAPFISDIQAPSISNTSKIPLGSSYGNFDSSFNSNITSSKLQGTLRMGGFLRQGIDRSAAAAASDATPDPSTGAVSIPSALALVGPSGEVVANSPVTSTAPGGSHAPSAPGLHVDTGIISSSHVSTSRDSNVGLADCMPAGEGPSSPMLQDGTVPTGWTSALPLLPPKATAGASRYDGIAEADVIERAKQVLLHPPGSQHHLRNQIAAPPSTPLSLSSSSVPRVLPARQLTSASPLKPHLDQGQNSTDIEFPVPIASVSMALDFPPPLAASAQLKRKVDVSPTEAYQRLMQQKGYVLLAAPKSETATWNHATQPGVAIPVDGSTSPTHGGAAGSAFRADEAQIPGARALHLTSSEPSCVLDDDRGPAAEAKRQKMATARPSLESKDDSISGESAIANDDVFAKAAKVSLVDMAGHRPDNETAMPTSQAAVASSTVGSPEPRTMGQHLLRFGESTMETVAVAQLPPGAKATASPVGSWSSQAPLFSEEDLRAAAAGALDLGELLSAMPGHHGGDFLSLLQTQNSQKDKGTAGQPAAMPRPHSVCSSPTVLEALSSLSARSISNPPLSASHSICPVPSAADGSQMEAGQHLQQSANVSKR